MFGLCSSVLKGRAAAASLPPFQNSFLGLAAAASRGRKSPRRKKGMEWDGRKREDGRGEKGRKQLEDTGDKSKERKKRSRAEESGLAKGGKGRTE